MQTRISMADGISLARVISSELLHCGQTQSESLELITSGPRSRESVHFNLVA